MKGPKAFWEGAPSRDGEQGLREVGERTGQRQEVKGHDPMLSGGKGCLKHPTRVGGSGNVGLELPSTDELWRHQRPLGGS